VLACDIVKAADHMRNFFLPQGEIMEDLAAQEVGTQLITLGSARYFSVDAVQNPVYVGAA
jgi:hypothetical protein